jgi:hypothetical protein
MLTTWVGIIGKTEKKKKKKKKEDMGVFLERKQFRRKNHILPLIGRHSRTSFSFLAGCAGVSGFFGFSGLCST